MWTWKGSDESHNIIHVTDPNSEVRSGCVLYHWMSVELVRGKKSEKKFKNTVSIRNISILGLSYDLH